MRGNVSYDFTGCRIVITGGGRGQGRQHTLRFLAAGAAVDVIDLFDSDSSQLRAVVPYPLATSVDEETIIRSAGDHSERLRTWPADLSDPAQVEQIAERLLDKNDQVDVLINNAGINSIIPFSELTPAAWHAMLDTNFLGGAYLTQALLPGLEKADSGAHVIFVSSLVAERGVPNQAHYAASKAAVQALTRSLAAELGPAGIRVNAVAPTLVASPQTKGLSKAADINALRPTMPSPYLLPGFFALRPDDVSSVVLWLASSGARFITGQIINVDCGRSVRC